MFNKYPDRSCTHAQSTIIAFCFKHTPFHYCMCNQYQREKMYKGDRAYFLFRLAAKRRPVSLTLLPKCMYKSDELFWEIFMLNCAFRFLWIIFSFLPAKHFSPSSGVIVNSFSSNVQSYVGPIVAGGEIIGHSLWGILRDELESTIMKLMMILHNLSTE